MPLPRLVAALLTLVWFTDPRSAMAQWVPNGVPLCEAPVGRGLTFWSSSIVADGSGGAFVVWGDVRDYFNGQLGSDVYVQHVLADGRIAPGWPKDGAPVCIATGDQAAPAIAADGAGGVFIAWIDHSAGVESDIYAQRLTASGTVAPGWDARGVPVCTAVGDQVWPFIASDGMGGIYVAWSDYRPGRSDAIQHVFVQRMTAQGTPFPGWPVDGLAIQTVSPNGHELNGILPDDSGGVFLLWMDSRTGSIGPDLYAIRISGDGQVAPGWQPGGSPVCQAAGDQGGGWMVEDGAGGFVVAWVDSRNGYYYDVFAQRMTASGAVAEGWPQEGLTIAAPVNTFFRNKMNVRVITDGAGGAIILWTDDRNYLETAADLYAQRVLPTGHSASGWPENGARLTHGLGWEYAYGPVADGAGGALVAYEFVNFDGYDVMAQHISASGAIATGWPAEGVSLSSFPHETKPVAVTDGAGGMIVAWEDQRTANPEFSRVDIYAQRVTGGCPDSPPVTVTVAAEPATVSPRSAGRWLKLTLEPPAAYSARDIDVSSLRVNGTIGVDAEAPLQIGDNDGDGIEELTVRFARTSVLANLETDAALSIGVTGRLADHCLVGHATIAIGSAARAAGVGAAAEENQLGLLQDEAALPHFATAQLRPSGPTSDAVEARVYLPEVGGAKLELFDIGGRRIGAETLSWNEQGWQSARIKPSGSIRPGVYFLRLQHPSGVIARRISILN